MADPNQEKQNQSSSKEDSTAMTIEFLRARLLSERSVSKSVRERADELKKRVEELEEQLRIVSLQRKMAEKATVDVLSILESRGISEASEAFDSGSDHETQEGNNYPNGAKLRIGSEELSGSDLDSSPPVNGRSLSWKGHTDSQRSREKIRDPSVRRRNTFSVIGSSSPKHHLGKSCRQNRRRDTRMTVEECKSEPVQFNSRENEVSDCSETGHKIAIEASGSVENGRSVANQLDSNGHLKGKDMEKALEDQAKLIGRYEEMEKDQRDWEEKFREKNNSTPDSYDPGNHSDITEERDEAKARTEEAKSEEPKVSIEPQKLQPNGFVPKPSHDDTTAPRFQPREFSFPRANGKESQPSPSSSETGIQNRDLYALVPHDPRNSLTGVLDALRQAKLQLHHKMNLQSLPESVAPIPIPVRKAIQAELSGGCAGLFRLPTDFATAEADTRASDYLGAVGSATPERFPQADPFLSRSSVVSGSRASSSSNFRFDPYADSGASRVNRYNQYSPQNFQDLMPRMPSEEGFRRTFPGSRAEFGVPAEDRMLFYDDRGGPNNMYR